MYAKKGKEKGNLLSAFPDVKEKLQIFPFSS